MSHSMMLQDWLTISGNNNTVIQNESGWLDVSGYQDACFYFQLGGNNQASATNVNVQTSPTKDDAFFTASISGGSPRIANFSTTSGSTLGVQSLVVSRWATDVNQPLSKFLRWSCTFPAAATTITFRIWVTLNQAGY